MAVVLIFLVLAAQFNSFRDPFVILAGSVPLAIFGALVFTFLKMPDPNVPFWTQGWTTTLNIYSQVGLVTLVGLVSKNGILIVEFANSLQRQGRAKREAVRTAAMTRLRPILMTTGATIAGHFPLTLVTGAGAQARNSIGLVLVGGMAIGTLFTLFVVPSIYMLVARDHSRDAEALIGSRKKHPERDACRFRFNFKFLERKMNLLLAASGVVLLVLGWKLFWLFVGVVGFAAGLQAAQLFLGLSPSGCSGRQGWCAGSSVRSWRCFSRNWPSVSGDSWPAAPLPST